MPGESSDIGGEAVELVGGDFGGASGGDSSELHSGDSAGDRAASGGDSDSVGAIFERSRGSSSRTRTSKGTKPSRMGAVPSVQVEEKPKRSTTAKAPTPKLDIQTFADVVTVGIFNTVAVATGHEHWLKEREEVLDFTVPLTAWVNQLPAKTVKKLEGSLAPAMAIAALASILGPDISEEIRLRRATRQEQVYEEGAKRTYATPAGGNGLGGPRSPANRGVGGKPEGVPSPPSINTDYGF